MGDDRHLVMSDLKDAADAAGISVHEVAKNIQQAVGQKGQQSNGNAQAQQGAGGTQETAGAQQHGQAPNGEARQPTGTAPTETPGAERHEQPRGTR